MKVAAVLMIILALVIGIVPQFTNCTAQGNTVELANGNHVPMKCQWSARAEIGVATPLLLTGIMLGLSKRKETIRNLSILGAVLGVLVVMLPTVLIGVCANPEMICNALMRPTLILSGSLVSILSLASLAASLRPEAHAAALRSA